MGFDDHPDPDWMTECADRAAILDDIRQMPMGFETLVGDMGSTLSGGQKQRVILARALYRRPAILFLDEATSHLDEATEAVVAQALRDLRITRVIVAHRPATIAHADKVINLENLGQSTPSSVHSTAAEATQLLPIPGAMTEATRPLGLGQQAEKSKNTRGNLAEIAGDNAETLPVLKIHAQQAGLAELAARSSPTPELKISLLASKRGEEAAQLSLGTRETGGIQAGTSANGTEIPQGVNGGEEQQGEVKWATRRSFRVPSPRILAPGSRAGGQAGHRVAGAAVSRADNIQVGEEAPAKGVSGRPFRTRKLKTSALLLAGAAIVVAVPTHLLAPRNEKIATSNEAGAPPPLPGAGSAGTSVVNSKGSLNDALAPTGLATAVAPTLNMSAPVSAAPASDFPGSEPIVTSSPVPPPLDETPIATKVPTTEGRLEVAPESGAPVAGLPINPAQRVTGGASGAAKASLEGVLANVPASSATQPALADLSAPRGETSTRVLSATDAAKGPFPDGAPIPPPRPAETTASDSRPGTANVSLAGAPASPSESNGAVKPTPSIPLEAAEPTRQFPNPVSVVSPPLDETPIATKVPAAGDRANAAQDETPTNGAPTPPVMPAETAAGDPAGTVKASAPKPGQMSRHRREASSPGPVAGTIGGFGTDRRSRELTPRKHTKAASATRASSDLRNPVEPPGGVDVPQAPNESGQPGDPLPLSGSVPSAAIGSVEAPAPAQQLTGHSTTR